MSACAMDCESEEDVTQFIQVARVEAPPHFSLSVSVCTHM